MTLQLTEVHETESVKVKGLTEKPLQNIKVLTIKKIGLSRTDIVADKVVVWKEEIKVYYRKFYTKMKVLKEDI